MDSFRRGHRCPVEPTGPPPGSRHYPPGVCADITHGTEARGRHHRHRCQTTCGPTHQHNRWVGSDDRYYRGYDRPTRE